MESLVATLRREIEVVIAAQERVKAPGVGRIGMKDLALSSL
jgi:hypothetical protein